MARSLTISGDIDRILRSHPENAASQNNGTLLVYVVNVPLSFLVVVR